MTGHLRAVPPPEPERYVDRREMADILGVGLTTLDQLVKDGMPSETWGVRTRRFLPSAAVRWARNRRKDDAA